MQRSRYDDCVVHDCSAVQTFRYCKGCSWVQLQKNGNMRKKWTTTVPCFWKCNIVFKLLAELPQHRLCATKPFQRQTKRQCPWPILWHVDTGRYQVNSMVPLLAMPKKKADTLILTAGEKSLHKPKHCWLWNKHGDLPSLPFPVHRNMAQALWLRMYINA